MSHDTIWAIVPVKYLAHTKTRLSSVLSYKRRAEVTLMLLNRQLQLLDQCQAIDNVLVVSRDSRVQALVSSWDCDLFKESEPPDLNVALHESYHMVGDAADYCLILPSDLPLFSAESLDQLLTTLPTAAICPDKAHNGTNALLLPTQTNFQFRFGIDSYRKHCKSFDQVSVSYHTLHLPEIEFDLDTPSDWWTWQTTLGQTPLAH